LVGPSQSKCTARRLRRRSEDRPARHDVVMNVVACGHCGERFEISHHAESQDAALAEKQAVWLQDQFVWHHIQEEKHPGSINLPGMQEMERV
jgi:hypothetical protein